MDPKEMAETLKANWVGQLHHWAESVRFAIEEAIAQEREACAKLVEDARLCTGEYNNVELSDGRVLDIESAIRARK